MTINIEALLAKTQDLESGHSVETILRKHNIPLGYSAYEVVRRYQKNVEYHASATSDYYRKFWKGAVAELLPCLKDIDRHMKEAQ